ncbi:Bug family tripartite tricarboxylate transporter substrate binding protein [Ostreibacterium oceani]|uniref:Tripartite tricarboxylate transporter substrate binding protein n=1 Tax=Ostreibacterium oceani TaxID=2654998 RepID=A0A6N7EZ97_9GAMM|nr:tripartite tricarboxylate transporter substrate-binding protein [Ostreibacterium oceani]MPV86487.1 tripartite tricarboxylate transporter substrate binding protein [Ostreibacterium oceani]
MNNYFNKPLLKASLLALVLGASVNAQATDIDKIHFLVPGGAGGGWDGTARGTGEALTRAGIVGNASYENMSGGGGGKAIAHLIESANDETLMVNSTPIIIRSLQKQFPQNFRDLTPVAGIIGDYAAMVVHKDSEINQFDDLVQAYKADPTKVAIGGGSVAGGMDHLVAALVMKGVGANPVDVKYIPYDAGGKAMAGLLSGEIKALSTGMSEALELARQGEVKILCVTAAERVADAPDYPTCKESGSDTEFVNWRGYFAAPNLAEDKKAAYIAAFEKMYETEAWETVRSRNGWINIWHPGDDFSAFLEAQEKAIADLMRELGFL